MERANVTEDLPAKMKGDWPLEYRLFLQSDYRRRGEITEACRGAGDLRGRRGISWLGLNMSKIGLQRPQHIESQTRSQSFMCHNRMTISITSFNLLEPVTCQELYQDTGKQDRS